MDNPLVTVIIPTFNRAGTVVRAIRSVLAQSWNNLEIIVVDDGSTDDTREIVDSITNTRIRYLRLPQNRGVASARNAGIEAARGDYVAFLDSDDEWFPNKLEYQCETLISRGNGARASCTGYRVVRGENRESWDNTLPEDRDMLAFLFLHGCDLSPGTTLVVDRRIFLEIGAFDPNLQRYEDWDWMLRYAQARPLAIVPGPMAMVHLSGTPRPDHLGASGRYFVEKWRAEAGRVALSGGRRLDARLRLELARSLLIHGRHKEGLGELARALWCWPLQHPRKVLTLVDVMLGSEFASRVTRRMQVDRPRSGL